MHEECAEEAEISEDEHQSGLDELEPEQIDDERQNDDAPPNEWSRDISLADQVKLGWIAHQKVRQGADFGKFCRRLAPAHPMRKEDDRTSIMVTFGPRNCVQSVCKGVYKTVCESVYKTVCKSVVTQHTT